MNPRRAFVLSCWGLLISENNPPSHRDKLCEKDALAGVLDTGLFTRDSRWLLQRCFLWVTRCSQTWWGFKKKKNYDEGAQGRRFSAGFLRVVVHSIQIMDLPSFLYRKCARRGDFSGFLGIPCHSLNSWRAARSLWCIFHQKIVAIPLMKHYKSLAWDSRLILLHLGYKTSVCLEWHAEMIQRTISAFSGTSPSGVYIIKVIFKVISFFQWAWRIFILAATIKSSDLNLFLPPHFLHCWYHENTHHVFSKGHQPARVFNLGWPVSVSLEGGRNIFLAPRCVRTDGTRSKRWEAMEIHLNLRSRRNRGWIRSRQTTTEQAHLTYVMLF